MLERLRTREVAVDTLMAIGFLVLGLTTQIEVSDIGIGPSTRAPDALSTALLVVYTLPLALRRVFPVTVFAIALVGVGVETGLDYPSTLARAGPLLAFHSLGTELVPRRSLLIGGGAVVATVAWTALGAVLYESVPPESVLAQLVITAVPLHLGREVHRRRARMQALQLRAEQAEREREEQARRAVAEERTRIARELHDVVAHQMTVMTIQADGAARVVRDGDPRVAGALTTIKETGQQALAEMRRMVGLLRTQDDEDPALVPLPRLADLDELVQRVHAAGVDVDLEVHGETRVLAEGVQLSAYRVIQESLTNAVRHGGPSTTAHVRVDYREEDLEVLVEDDGRGAAADGGVGGGHGLLGMRERVAVLGGSFEAGPRQGGGFRVHATIPYDS